MRVATRLMELGVITAEQGMNLFHTGKFPEAEDLEKAQSKFVDQREKGYFNPLVGGVPMIEDDSPSEPTNSQKAPGGGLAGRPEGSPDQFSRENIQATIYEIEALNSLAKEKMLEKLEEKALNEDQEKMVSKLCESIVCASDKENWTESLISCVNDFNEIEKLGAMENILNVSEAHQLEIYPSAILYHSKNYERN
jgi:hypothetical protein